MKVKDLIKQLEAMDPEAIVIMSKDSEGNRVSPLGEVIECRYEAENAWSGEIYFEYSLDDDSEYDTMDSAVSLWPVN